MKTKGILVILSVGMSAGIFWLMPVQAIPVTIEIEAVVDTVWDEGNYLEDRIRPGDIITGWYTYESTTPDSSPSDMVQGNYWYYAPPAGLSLTVGGFNFETDPEDVEFRIALRNEITPWGGDIYAIGSSNNLALSNGTPVDSIWWQLDDRTGSALSSDVLPTMPPVLDRWQANVLSLESDRAFGIHGHVISAIPEPTSILLLAVGVLLVRKGK
jgi:hypothetical protein